MSSVLALLYFCVKSWHYFKKKKSMLTKSDRTKQMHHGKMATLMAITTSLVPLLLSKFGVFVTVSVVTVVVVSVLMPILLSLVLATTVKILIVDMNAG